MEIIKYATIALAIGLGLYGLWKLVGALEIRKLQREEKASWAAGNVSICRYGVNADGEITRIRTCLTKEEIAARDSAPDDLSALPEFLRVPVRSENPAAKK